MVISEATSIGAGIFFLSSCGALLAGVIVGELPVLPHHKLYRHFYTDHRCLQSPVPHYALP